MVKIGKPPKPREPKPEYSKSGRLLIPSKAHSKQQKKKVHRYSNIPLGDSPHRTRTGKLVSREVYLQRREDAKTRLPYDPKTGKFLGGPGRKKGVPNKFSRQAKENIAEVFDRMGGIEAMLAWARGNPDVFYAQIYTKLIPVHVQAQVEVEHKGEPSAATAALERILTGILAQRSEPSGPAPVIIDGRTNQRTSPQLVLPGPTGANTTDG